MKIQKWLLKKVNLKGLAPGGRLGGRVDSKDNYYVYLSNALIKWLKLI
jgi:hypothetical protein